MSDNYMGVLLEEIRDQNKAILEAVGDMQAHVTKIPAIQNDTTDLKQDMKVIKAAVTDISHDVQGLDQRVTRLEARP